MNEVEKARLEVEKAQAKLLEAIETQKALQALTIIEQGAIALHNKLCKRDHTDQCGWYYSMSNGIPTWQDSTQKEYYEKAEDLYDAVCSYDNFDSTFLAVIEAL